MFLLFCGKRTPKESGRIAFVRASRHALLPYATLDNGIEKPQRRF